MGSPMLLAPEELAYSVSRADNREQPNCFYRVFIQYMKQAHSYSADAYTAHV